MKKIRDEISSLERRIDALRLAERALISAMEAPSLTKRRTSTAIVPGSIKAEVIKLLNDYPNGLPASKILTMLQGSTWPKLIRTSLSPQLSRLKQSGILQYQDKNWLLAEDKEEGS